ncbi:hypothetical protein BAUCODRAFT_184003 [Baudoinia panamericana UAMH 10762]|uniref:Nudix hydrolase domain-containing protein n=1 Tax=Baudoinia panamericana (strain UAMH 10762) TaxID=717646 RepID=M2N9E2_BAUPA|nr:uncharacterized protein BAUCODRAFT_184003 [Baudoinia panamericana UAMH 10762]EMD00799.1 hypothetical protein BAUCODRAFT_184003 [Baudoinia panamericana UAMH 10762]
MSVPQIGVGVFVFRSKTDPHFVIGVRKGSTGAGTYALPGGHLEYGESFEKCAVREVMEETGLAICDVRFLTATNSVFADVGKHYVTIFMVAVAAEVNGVVPQPRLLEPDKCEGWGWCTLPQMRDMDNAACQLFQPLLSLMEQRPDSCELLEHRSTP